MIKTHSLIFGIGNPLIDIVIQATDNDLDYLNMHKGTMELVDQERQAEIFKYFQNKNFLYFPGGSAANTIIACAGLGISSNFSGKIGNDNFGEMYLERFKQYGIDNCIVSDVGPTGSSIVLITPDGERTMNTHLGISRQFSSDDINAKQLSQSKYLYFTGYMWDTENQKASIEKAISIAHENNIIIVFDVADPFVVKRNKDAFIQLINEHVDIVFSNHSELKILFNSNSVDSSVSELMNYTQSGGIKLGKRGSIVFHDKEKFIVKPSPISAIDSTGAGDMYAAGFLASISSGNNYQKSGEIAVQLAEEIIQIQGAQFEEKIMKQLKSKILFN